HAIANGGFAVQMFEPLSHDLEHLLPKALVEHCWIRAHRMRLKLLIKDKRARAGMALQLFGFHRLLCPACRAGLDDRGVEFPGDVVERCKFFRVERALVCSAIQVNRARISIEY